MSENGSPTRTALLLVRHQHRIGSASTFTVPGGAAGVSCAASATPPAMRIPTKIAVLPICSPSQVRSSKFKVQSQFKLQTSHFQVSGALPQPPLHHELGDRNDALNLIESELQHIDARVLRRPLDVVLPVAYLLRHLPQ